MVEGSLLERSPIYFGLRLDSQKNAGRRRAIAKRLMLLISTILINICLMVLIQWMRFDLKHESKDKGGWFDD